MSTKREGFLARLFGRAAQQPRSDAEEALRRATGEVPTSTDELEALRRTREAEAMPADDAHIPAGPPETTVDYVEEVEAHHPPLEQPEVVPPTPMPTDRAEVPVAHEPAPAAPAQPVAKQSWLQRLTGGLKRSSDQLSRSINDVFAKRRLNDETLADLEDILIQSDLGMAVAEQVTEALRREKFDKDVSGPEVRAALATEVAACSVRSPGRWWSIPPTGPSSS